MSMLKPELKPATAETVSKGRAPREVYRNHEPMIYGKSRKSSLLLKTTVYGLSYTDLKHLGRRTAPEECQATSYAGAAGKPAFREREGSVKNAKISKTRGS